ncbi:MAG: bifunctional adenosylcobinamide kinase/adenosylcobinamide-phosphate guanylyltransferase [Deltaproteobacteria bacterium]|nr:bifunctional adenosylcobinamide kinase/adenosylcobinamide-phosphate guanylyltransferase [Deltaproteobacteria bacterium]
MNRVIVIGGGVRSGKSAFALERARELGPRRAFLATAQAFDDEMRDRIAQHRRERGPDFATIEEPLAVPEAIAALRDVDVVVVDCLTLWLSNLLLIDAAPAPILRRVDDLVAVLARRACHAILVTNEVGMGVVPPSPLGRAFRDVCGIAHQRLAAIADEVDIAMLGAILRIHPAPVALARPLR